MKRLPEDRVFKNNVNQSVRMFMEGPTIRGRLARGVAAYTVSTIFRAQKKKAEQVLAEDVVRTAGVPFTVHTLTLPFAIGEKPGPWPPVSGQILFRCPIQTPNGSGWPTKQGTGLACV